MRAADRHVQLRRLPSSRPRPPYPSRSPRQPRLVPQADSGAPCSFLHRQPVANPIAKQPMWAMYATPPEPSPNPYEERQEALEDGPGRQEPLCRHAGHPPEEAEHEERAHLDAREYDQVHAEYARQGPRCADCGDGARRLDGRVGQPRRDAPPQVHSQDGHGISIPASGVVPPPVMQLGTAPHSKNSCAARALPNSQNCPVQAISQRRPCWRPRAGASSTA